MMDSKSEVQSNKKKTHFFSETYIMLSSVFKLMKCIAFADGAPTAKTKKSLDELLPKWCSGKNADILNVINNQEFTGNDHLAIERKIISCLENLLQHFDAEAFRVLKHDLHVLARADDSVTENEEYALQLIDQYLAKIDPGSANVENVDDDKMTANSALGILYYFMMCIDGEIAPEEECAIRRILREWDDLSARKILAAFSTTEELMKPLFVSCAEVDVSNLRPEALQLVTKAVGYLRDNAERNMQCIFLDHLCRIAKADHYIHPNERFFWEMIKKEWRDLCLLVAAKEA